MKLHDYQIKMIDHQLSNPKSMIWGFMGCGKTVVTLTTISLRMKMRQVKKTLVIAPLRVAVGVWIEEAKKWEHLEHLKFSLLHGKNKNEALAADADIYLINYEGLPWLVEELSKSNDQFDFDFCVYDEISKMKNARSLRFAGSVKYVKDDFGNTKTIKKSGFKSLVPKFKYITGLTGTPACNGYLDLFGQFLAIDNGERLGKYITHYRNNYFHSDRKGWVWTLTKEGKQQIEDKINDITLSMSDANNYIDLPKIVYKDIWIELPKKAKKHYDELEKNLFSEFDTESDTGFELELLNNLSASNKCLQICNGNIYYDDKQSWTKIHDSKLKALDEILEDAAGQPVLCAYNFKSDASCIMQYFKKYKPVNLTDEKSKNIGEIIHRWNSGEIKLLIGHPGSMGHGIDNLQKSGSIVVWFGLPWSLELYSQMNARIYRQGQTKIVSIVHILAKNTIDEIVLLKLNNKTMTQQNLKKAIARYKKSKNNE